MSERNGVKDLANRMIMGDSQARSEQNDIYGNRGSADNPGSNLRTLGIEMDMSSTGRSIGTKIKATIQRVTQALHIEQKADQSTTQKGAFSGYVPERKQQGSPRDTRQTQPGAYPQQRQEAYAPQPGAYSQQRQEAYTPQPGAYPQQRQEAYTPQPGAYPQQRQEAYAPQPGVQQQQRQEAYTPQPGAYPQQRQEAYAPQPGVQQQPRQQQSWQQQPFYTNMPPQEAYRQNTQMQPPTERYSQAESDNSAYSNVVYFPGVYGAEARSGYAHVEYIVCIHSRKECVRVISYMKANASVFLNMEYIASDRERQSCLDVLSGAIFTLECSLSKISTGYIYLISSPRVKVVPDPTLPIETVVPEDYEPIARRSTGTSGSDDARRIRSRSEAYTRAE